MKFLVLIAALSVMSAAQAEEIFLGTIVSNGSDTTNATTAAPFCIPQSAPISIQCDAVAYVAVNDSTVVTVLRGIYLTARSFLITTTATHDQVTISGVQCATVRVAGPAATNCSVWSRRGNE